MSRDYHTQLFLAWTVRTIMAASLLIIFAMIGSGCSHTLTLNSSGDLKKDPPPSTIQQ